MSEKIKPHFLGSDLNNLPIKDVKELQLNQDAQSADEAVRKSQAEQISADAVQDKIIEQASDASNDTTFSSASVVSKLSAKQDNLSIHPDSTAFAELVDGNKIRIKTLTTNETVVDNTYSSLADLLSNSSQTGSVWTINGVTIERGDYVKLQNPAVPTQERSWINNGGTSGTVADFISVTSDYNVADIRSMFSGTLFIDYDTSGGFYTLRMGTDQDQVGAQTLPVDATKFQVLATSNSDQEKVNLALESYIQSVDTNATGGTNTLTIRLNNLSGVTGNNMETFNEGLFTPNSNQKDLFQESETLHKQAINDRALIRTQFGTADADLDAKIEAETLRALSAESSEASARQAADNNLQGQVNQNQSAINAETNRAVTAENALDARLDTVEGDDSTVGSIAHGVKEAKDYTDNKVSLEASTRATADANLQTQIDALQGAFQYKGYVGADGRIVHVDPLSPNNDKVFENASFTQGEFYKMNADLTFTFGDGSTISVNTGDGLIVINTCAAGTCVATDFHKGDNTENADIIREGMLDGVTIEKSAGVVKVVDDSIGRTQLDPSVETDIDNKVLKSGDEMTGALKIFKTVTAGTGYSGGYDYAAYVKMKSIDTAALTDTQRGLLVENEVYTNGSGNPLSLNYSNSITSASHYKGSSNNMTLATVGGNFEANVDSSLAAVYATGAYGVATSNQLGVNAGGTFLAQNAATANLGVFGFSDTAGALTNRAAYFALSTDVIDFDQYRVERVANPLAVQDAALILDDYTGVKHALYANGKCEFNGKVIIPSATADNEAVNKGDIKNTQAKDTFTINPVSDYTFNHGLSSEELILSVWYQGVEIASSLHIEATTPNALKITNETNQTLTDVKIFVSKLS